MVPILTMGTAMITGENHMQMNMCVPFVVAADTIATHVNYKSYLRRRRESNELH